MSYWYKDPDYAKKADKTNLNRNAGERAFEVNPDKGSSTAVNIGRNLQAVVRVPRYPLRTSPPENLVFPDAMDRPNARVACKLE